MADQVYDLTQTGAQVQAIIYDANKVMGAGSQSTLTTDSILLKDTSGNYHKIDKSSFTEAVRNTMASLLVNNDKGTTISQIAAIASGDFGSVTPANLASVLGGLAPVKTKTVYALYTSTTNQRYIVITCPDEYYTMHFKAFTMSNALNIEGVISIGNNQVSSTTNAKKIAGGTVDVKIYRTEGSTNNNRVVIDIAKLNDQMGVVLYTSKANVTISTATSESVGSLTEVTIG